MSFDSSDLFGTTPPRTRVRSKNKMNNNPFTESKSKNGGRDDKKLSFFREVARTEVTNSPRSSMRKKKTEIRSHQRDVKLNGMESTGGEAFGDGNIVIGRGKSMKGGDILTLETSQTFRCLSNSCISESDFSELASKNKNEGAKNKANKKRSKHKFPKPSPSDQRRLRYMQRFRQVVAAGNSRQCQIDAVSSAVDNKTQISKLRISELIWLELQAWHNGTTISKQDQVLYNARKTLVTEVLSFVSVFLFDDQYLKYFDKLKIKIDTVLKDMPEVVCEQCDSSLLNADSSYSSQFSEEDCCNGNYLMLNVSRGNSYENGRDSSGNSDSESFTFFDSSSKDVANPGEGENRLLHHDILPRNQYMLDQEKALIKVDEIMKLMCIIENLYPSSSALAKEYVYYKDDTFQNKVESMSSWFNITSDLRNKFLTFLKTLFSNSFNPTEEFLNDIQEEEEESQDPHHAFHNHTFLPTHITETSLDDSIRVITNRMLKQKSVRTILQFFLIKNFRSLFRAKMNMMPNSYYLSSEDMLEMENSKTKDEKSEHQSHHAKFTIGGETGEEKTYIKSAKLFRTFSPATQNHQIYLLTKMLEQMRDVFPDAHFKMFEVPCKDAIFEEAAPISPSDDATAAFGLPSIHPLYVFFPSLIFAIMKHCMHMRLEQAMPFFHNSNGSSICLLTAKQLVMESKEMLECGLLTRDIIYFFLIDVENNEIMENCMKSVESFDKDLHSMITTYLDFVDTWLVRMLGDLPHAPRGFQDILEQEWYFSNKISPRIDFGSVVTCACSFIKIASNIVNSTREFLVSAIGALIQSQNEGPIFNVETPVEEEEPFNLVPRHSSESAVEIQDKRFCSRSSHFKPQAGVLWFNRQRSESPHLSRHNSLPSSACVTPVSSPGEFERQASSSSTSSGGSLPWIQYKNTTSHLENQRRYLFELCRAVRELFHEERERAIRILSFGKRLRKSLEPAIGFDFTEQGEVEPCSCCRLLESLQHEGYMLVDFSEISSQFQGKKSTENGPESSEDAENRVDLDEYWVFIPKSVPQSENEPDSPRNGEEGTHNSPVLWSLIKNALFSHLQPSSQRESQVHSKNINGVHHQVQCLLFVRKPKSISENHAINAVRRKSDLVGAAERKMKSKKTKKKNEKENQRAHKSKSEGNLLGKNFNEENCSSDSTCSVWSGDHIKINDKDHDTHNKECLDFLHLMCKSFELTHDITVILASADDLGVTRKELSNLFVSAARLAVAQKPIIRNIKDSLNLFRLEVIRLCNALKTSIDKALKCLDSQCQAILRRGVTRVGSWDMDSAQQVKSEVNEVMQSCFNFGFEFIKEATRIMSGDFRTEMDKMHMDFAKQWMEYVIKHRDKGKGHRPRWASHGLTFVSSIDGSFLLTLEEEDFSSLKTQIDLFIDHLIGSTSPTQSKDIPLVESKSFCTLQVPSSQPQVLRSLSNSSATYLANNVDVSTDESLMSDKDDYDEGYKQSPIERIRTVIAEMEEDLDEKRYDAKNIGRITHTPKASPIVNLGIRTVSFRWQRGTKVGEGGFGRVYTCVNVDTGTILAMKEVKIQQNDHQKIRSALDEFTNFEGIKHPNLVQYYGVELHREDMYIFMEYCDGGTLGDMCKFSLPEVMIRRYTAQILDAVHALHMKGIVHRDIKGSNIFLTSEGVIKLGDFGSALKLKDKYRTTPGEMVSHIGTTMAYTAPEVINSSEEIGYGRAADIWSLGCVVIEMGSGKKPWHDLERVQIMFKVGSGIAPQIPACFSEDGKKFVRACTITDPNKRWTAEQLQGHPFVKVPSIDY